MVAIVPSESPLSLAHVRGLLQEYAAALDFDLCFRGFQAELAGLPGEYAPPTGRLLPALAGDEAAGCVALRRIDDATCEMKRLDLRRGRPAALLFDLDGTLVDTIDLIVHCFARLLEPATGRPWGRDEIVALFGPTEPAILARFGLAGALPDFLACYERSHDRLARPFPGVAAALERARRAGLRLAVITNKGRETTAITLRRTGLASCFDAVVTGDDTGRPKPDPAGLLLALERLGVAPGEAVFVGDAPSDVEAGRRAGVGTWAVAWGRVHPLEELVAARPDRLLRHPAELDGSAADGEPPATPLSGTPAAPPAAGRSG